MGLVLAAVTNATGWSGLDQYKAAGLELLEANHTTFMEKGPCSRYKGVVHQYAIKPSIRGVQQQRQQQWRGKPQCAPKSGVAVTRGTKY